MLGSPISMARLMDCLADREVIRNEALLLLAALSAANGELQKIAAFEGAFDRVFAIADEEGGCGGGMVVVADALGLLATLLRGNLANQRLFRWAPPWLIVRCPLPDRAYATASCSCVLWCGGGRGLGRPANPLAIVVVARCPLPRTPAAAREMDYISRLPPLLAYTPVPPQAAGDGRLMQLAASAGAAGAAAAVAVHAAAGMLPPQVTANYLAALAALALLVAPPRSVDADQRAQEAANRTSNQAKLAVLGVMQHLLVLGMHAGGAPAPEVRTLVGTPHPHTHTHTPGRCSRPIFSWPS